MQTFRCEDVLEITGCSCYYGEVRYLIYNYYYSSSHTILTIFNQSNDAVYSLFVSYMPESLCCTFKQMLFTNASERSKKKNTH